MDKKLQAQLKSDLEKAKKQLTQQLQSFAKKDPRLKGDWDTSFPKFGNHRSEQDENADEVEQYEALLPVEHALEKRLVDVDKALEKIAKGKYGKCEKCQKPIEPKRLQVVPEATLCIKCKDAK